MLVDQRLEPGNTSRCGDDRHCPLCTSKWGRGSIGGLVDGLNIGQDQNEVASGGAAIIASGDLLWTTIF